MVITVPTNLANRAQITYTSCGDVQDVVLSNQINTRLIDRYTLSVAKLALTGSVCPGETAAYVLRLENTGSGTLYNPTLTDNLGSDTDDKPLEYVDGSALFYVNGTAATGTAEASDSGVTFVLSEPLEAGSNLLVIYAATVDQASDECITNTVSATANADSATGAEVTGTATAEICIGQFANISVFKSADKDSVVEGDTLTYTFTLMNTGSGAAENISFRDALPDEFSVTSVSYTAGGVTTPITSADYSIEAPNTLVIPAAGSALEIDVEAADAMGPGITIITVTGTIG